MHSEKVSAAERLASASIAALRIVRHCINSNSTLLTKIFVAFQLEGAPSLGVLVVPPRCRQSQCLAHENANILRPPSPPASVASPRQFPEEAKASSEGKVFGLSIICFFF
jgi:hypothetical protein